MWWLIIENQPLTSLWTIQSTMLGFVMLPKIITVWASNILQVPKAEITSLVKILDIHYLGYV